MGTLLHFKHLYFEAFDDLKPSYVVLFLKGYSIFCAVMLAMAVYAFLYRAFTGFEFWLENFTLLQGHYIGKWDKKTHQMVGFLFLDE